VSAVLPPMRRMASENMKAYQAAPRSRSRRVSLSAEEADSPFLPEDLIRPNFDETVRGCICVFLGSISPKHAESDGPAVRSSWPNGRPRVKSKKVLVNLQGADRQKEARKAGADIVAAEEIVLCIRMKKEFH